MIYHYTSGRNIIQIKESGVLLPFNKNNEHSVFFPNAKLALWFTKLDKIVESSSAGNKEIWRIGVDDSCAPLDWFAYHAQAVANGEPRKFLRIIKKSMPHWKSYRCTFEPVYQKDWKIVERIK